MVAAAVLILPAGSVSAETLRDALNAAYRYNPQLDAERARLRATDEEVARANSGYRPRFTGSADITARRTDTRPPSPSDGRTVDKGYSLQATQNIFNGFGTRNAVNEAEAIVRAGREQLRLVEQNVLLAAVTAYMDVVRDVAILRLRENNVRVLSNELQATEARFKVGEVTRTDVAQAQARRAGSISALDLARANLKTSRATYERVVGRPPNNLIEPGTGVRGVPRSLDEAIAIAHRESPGIVAALYREQAARYTVDRIWAERLPQINLTATYTNRFDPSPITKETERAEIMGKIDIPFYTGGEVEARVRQAKHTHVSRLQEVEQFRTEARASVISAWSQLLAARAQLESDQTQVSANRTALTGVREEQKVGQRTLLDVLNAEQELLNSEVNYVTTRRNLVVAGYQVIATIGRLNVQELALASKVYDPEVHYHEVRRKWFGVSITHGDGRRERFEARDHHRPLK